MRLIAIPFELDESWIGGVYYIRNLVSALKLLPADQQPFILLVSKRLESVRIIQETGYPHLGWLTQADVKTLAAEGLIDVVFPHPLEGQETRTISWIPDFQELHLGHFFSEQEIRARRGHHRARFATAGLVVSSEDVRKDIDTFYPGECENVAVVRFASFDTPESDKVDAVRLQYEIPERYVFCANQVWLHKNHIVVIRAVALLKDMGIDVTMIFTGNESDYRVAGYADFLKRQLKEWGVDDRVRFLGFIPRADQLCLMKGARYIVQPSLFEGWSTVVEDAKSMGKFIVASDLAVHKEQLTEACRFFFRHDPQDLAHVMAQIEEHEKTQPLPVRAADYSEAKVRFGHDFMAAVERFLPKAGRGFDDRAVSRVRALSDANLAGHTILSPAPAEPAAARCPPLALRKGEQILFDGRGAELGNCGWRASAEDHCESALTEASLPLQPDPELCRGGAVLRLELLGLPGEARHLRLMRGGEVLFDQPLTEGPHHLELPLSASAAASAPLQFSARSAAGQPCALNIALHSLEAGLPVSRPADAVPTSPKAEQPMPLTANAAERMPVWGSTLCFSETQKDLNAIYDELRSPSGREESDVLHDLSLVLARIVLTRCKASVKSVDIYRRLIALRRPDLAGSFDLTEGERAEVALGRAATTLDDELAEMRLEVGSDPIRAQAYLRILEATARLEGDPSLLDRHRLSDR